MSVSYCLHKFLKLYVPQTRNCLSSRFLLLKFIFRGMFLLLIHYSLFNSSSRFKEFFLGCLVVRSSLMGKKEKLAEMTSCYDPFSLVVLLVVICCHSLSLDVSPVCLFINDLVKILYKMKQNRIAE